MAEPTSQLEALLTRAAFAPINNVGWIRVTGEDRVRWLNGMVTNSIQALKPGEGCYNFFLNAQGRIQGDCTAWLHDDQLLLQTAADRLPALLVYLDRFIIMDDVELTREDFPGVSLTGPEAPRLLRALELGVDLPDTMRAVVAEWQKGRLHIAHAYSPLVPRFEIWSDPATLGLLCEVLRNAGAVEASPEALEHLRLLEATPLYGTDIRDKELAQETNQTRALHFSKGCYLGQEIVERIRSRGQVNRLFTPLMLTGDLPAPGTVLIANDKPAGEITSAAAVPGHGILALGYVRREALESKAPLTYAGGTVEPRAVSSQLLAVS